MAHDPTGDRPVLGPVDRAGGEHTAVKPHTRPPRRPRRGGMGIGTHREVVLYAVSGWRHGDPPEQRFGATCEECGVWRGPDLDTVHQTLTTVACSVPDRVCVGLTPAAMEDLATALDATTTPPRHP